jgi:hypothetical protein
MNQMSEENRYVDNRWIYVDYFPLFINHLENNNRVDNPALIHRLDFYNVYGEGNAIPVLLIKHDGPTLYWFFDNDERRRILNAMRKKLLRKE